jgi:hypothetical protein
MFKFGSLLLTQTTLFILSLTLVFSRCGQISSNYNDNLESQTAAQASITRTSKFNVFEFNPKKMKMGVSLKKPQKADFYLNSNFFNKKPIGLVVIKGKRSQSRVKGGGYFYVKDGIPNVKVKDCPKRTEYASQTILWGIDNGQVNQGLIQEKHAKTKEFRSIIGLKKDGNFLLVASNENTQVTIKEITNYALELGMYEGILFDGGSSLDYKMTTDKDTEICQPISSLMKRLGDKKEPPVYIYGNFR